MDDNRVDALYPSTNDRTRDPSIVAEQNSHHDLAHQYSFDRADRYAESCAIVVQRRGYE